MFYNQNAKILKTILKGDFASYANLEKAREAEQSPPVQNDTGGFSGARALTAETVTRFLEKHDFTVIHRAGIRIFHDHISGLTEERLEGLLELEKNYRSVEPFASLAQHLHLVCHYNAS